MSYAGEEVTLGTVNKRVAMSQSLDTMTLQNTKFKCKQGFVSFHMA